MMKPRNLLLSALLVLPAVSIAAGDAEAGKAKSTACAACHGPDGISLNDVTPNLAGQKAPYLVSQMKAFRDGDRENPMMSPMAKGLSDEDIENLAAFYSSLK